MLATGEEKMVKAPVGEELALWGKDEAWATEKDPADAAAAAARSDRRHRNASPIAGDSIKGIAIAGDAISRRRDRRGDGTDADANAESPSQGRGIFEGGRD